MSDEALDEQLSQVLKEATEGQFAATAIEGDF